MPPRYSYWTILAGGLPTSFRAADREDLLPTLRRLQERHPDAEMNTERRWRHQPSIETRCGDDALTIEKAWHRCTGRHGLLKSRHDWRPLSKNIRRLL